jgi:hypothetical protein
MMDSISWMFADKPAHVMGKAACHTFTGEDVSVGTRCARGGRGSFCDCNQIRIFPSLAGQGRQSFL